MKVNDEITRSIRLPSEVWEAFVDDARRCRRSANMHLEAVLVQYLGLEDTQMRAIKGNEEIAVSTITAKAKLKPVTEKAQVKVR